MELAPGLRANLALALQSISVEVLDEARPGAPRAADARRGRRRPRRPRAGRRWTPAGADDEEAYWRIVEAKTPPLLYRRAADGRALRRRHPRRGRGARRRPGVPLGMLVQLGDDLGDVMGAALHPDWERPGDNVALRFALEADHPDRERFRSWSPRGGRPRRAPRPGDPGPLRRLRLLRPPHARRRGAGPPRRARRAAGRPRAGAGVHRPPGGARNDLLAQLGVEEERAGGGAGAMGGLAGRSAGASRGR